MCDIHQAILNGLTEDLNKILNRPFEASISVIDPEYSYVSITRSNLSVLKIRCLPDSITISGGFNLEKVIGHHSMLIFHRFEYEDPLLIDNIICRVEKLVKFINNTARNKLSKK